MRLFGKKQDDGTKPSKTSKPKLTKEEKKAAKAREKKRKKQLKFHHPADEKRIMWLIAFFLVAMVTLSTSYFGIRNINNQQHAIMMARSMKPGDALKQFGDRTGTGVLTIGNIVRSADGKDLAVQIKYDQAAQTSMATQGDRYKLRVVGTDKSSDMKNAQYSYGFFGTDGSGVLHIHKADGFRDEAFVVMLVDTSKLLSGDAVDQAGAGALNDDSDSDSEDGVDKSITAKLSGTNGDSSSDDADATDAESSSDDSDSDTKNMSSPLIYFARLNGANVGKAKDNWPDDVAMIKDLFINDRLAQLKDQVKSAEKSNKQLRANVDEYQSRVDRNPDDSTAKDSLESAKLAVKNNDDMVASREREYDKLSHQKFNTDILQPKQSKFEWTQVETLEGLKNKKNTAAVNDEDN